MVGANAISPHKIGSLLLCYFGPMREGLLCQLKHQNKGVKCSVELRKTAEWLIIVCGLLKVTVKKNTQKKISAASNICFNM